MELIALYLSIVSHNSSMMRAIEADRQAVVLTTTHALWAFDTHVRSQESRLASFEVILL